MTEHESQAIFKIVIPFEEYERLKTIEVQYHNLQKQYVSLQSEKKLKEKTDNTLVNEGESAHIADGLQGSGEISEISNENKETSVSVPTLLEVNEQTQNLIQPGVKYVKCDESNDSEDLRLLKTVPKAHIKRAQELLTILNERSAELTWNKDGILLIDQVPIPHSNIFSLYKYLFIRKKPIQCEGFIELHDKIQSMGLSHFINIRHRIKEAKKIKKVTIKDASFWYLG